VQTMTGNEGAVRSVAFGPAAEPENVWLASGGADHVVKQWQVTTGECLKTMAWHDEVVWSVDCGLLAEGAVVIASGSGDGTIRLWDTDSGNSVCIMRPQRPYEEMNITGVTGLSEAQRKTLLALGAIQK